MTTVSREYVNEAFWRNTIIVNTGDASPIDFNLSMEEKEALFSIGFETAKTMVPVKALA